MENKIVNQLEYNRINVIVIYFIIIWGDHDYKNVNFKILNLYKNTVHRV